MSEDEIWHRIKERAIDRFTKVVVGFAQRCRKRLLTTEQLADLVARHTCVNIVEQQFLGLGQMFYKAYLERLQVTGEEDFDGLMQQATSVVASGQTVFHRKSGSGDLKQLRYILIDEYQDFSELFHGLIKAIRAQNPQSQCFCVGDDWQAINGFAGSDLRFYHDFAQLFQPSRKLYITTNYRSTTAIVDTGNALMRGLGTPARAHTRATGTVIVANLKMFEPTPSEQEHHPGDVLTPAVLRLVNKVLGEGKRVVLLSRKNSLPWFVNYTNQRGRSTGTELDAFLKLIQVYSLN